MLTVRIGGHSAMGFERGIEGVDGRISYRCANACDGIVCLFQPLLCRLHTKRGSSLEKGLSVLLQNVAIDLLGTDVELLRQGDGGDAFSIFCVEHLVDLIERMKGISLRRVGLACVLHRVTALKIAYLDPHSHLLGNSKQDLHQDPQKNALG